MKISIVTATYNYASTLEQTIQSVLQQTFPDIEYIIIDGNSTDETPQIVARYAKQFGERLIYVREADKGLYDAMNKGLRLATGDVVAILNADDFFTSNDIIERVADYMSEHKEIDAVYGDVHFVRPDDLTQCVRYYSSRPFRRGLMRLGFMPAHPSFYCRRQVYQSYGYFDTSYRVGADFEMLLRFIFIHRISMAYLPIDFVTMRMGGISTSGITSYRQILVDIRHALRNNGVKSSYPLLMLRYAYKISELIWSKMCFRSYGKNRHKAQS